MFVLIAAVIIGALVFPTTFSYFFPTKAEREQAQLPKPPVETQWFGDTKIIVFAPPSGSSLTGRCNAPIKIMSTGRVYNAEIPCDTQLGSLVKVVERRVPATSAQSTGHSYLIVTEVIPPSTKGS